jgi:hypothetical protein
VALGDQKYQAGDYAAALKAYRGADALMKVPTTGIEVGRAQVALGLLVEARDTLLRVSRYPVQPNEPEPFARARESAAEMAAKLAPRIPSLQIQIAGLPDSASRQVRLDGQALELATVGLPRKTNPGKHVVGVVAPGYHPLELPVVLEEGEVRVLDVRLRPASEPAEEPMAEDDEPMVISPWVWVGVGVAGGATLLGAITGGASLAMAGDVKDQCSDDVCPAAAESDADTSVALAHVSTVSFIVAGAGAAFGVVALLWPELFDGGAAAETAIRPTIGPGSVGLVGQF